MTAAAFNQHVNMMRTDGEAAAQVVPRFNDGLRVGRIRLLFILFVFLIAYFAVAGRLTYLGWAYQTLDTAPKNQQISLDLPRADLLDRRNHVLAKTLSVPSVSANPRLIRDPKRAAQQIRQVFPELNEAKLIQRLSSDASFFWIKRGISPQQQNALMWKGVVGVEFHEEPRRVYPYGNLTSHVVGFTNIDNHGLAGIERSLEGVLSGLAEPAKLSLDLRLQHIVHDELSKQMKHFDAKAASGILMDVNTGEVLSMVSLPDYDPKAPHLAMHDQLFNTAAQGVYELGSVFKLFTAAMALENNVIDPDDMFDISKPLLVGGRRITDYHPEKGYRTVEEILEVSSNIGAAQIALAVGSERQRDFLDKLGLLSETSLELPEIGQPLVPDRWRRIRTATVSYGHGISVSPVQLAAGVATMVNGGYKVNPTLLRRDTSGLERQRVISEKTSAQMRHLMEQVVVDGTGRNSAVEGYRIGGKTGTADKAGPNGYDKDRRIANFVSAFPIENPQYVLVVVFDEPQGRADTGYYATGGVVAAPVSKNIISRAVSVLGIPPSSYQHSEENVFWRLMSHAQEF